MTNDLTELLERLEKAEGPDARLDGELDVLVDHENEQWPPTYTRDVHYLMAIARRKGLDERAISVAVLGDHRFNEERPIALLYAEALIRALISQPAPSVPTGEVGGKTDG
jgi:hypothetical protein